MSCSRKSSTSTSPPMPPNIYSITQHLKITVKCFTRYFKSISKSQLMRSSTTCIYREQIWQILPSSRTLRTSEALLVRLPLSLMDSSSLVANSVRRLSLTNRYNFRISTILHISTQLQMSSQVSSSLDVKKVFPFAVFSRERWHTFLKCNSWNLKVNEQVTRGHFKLKLSSQRIL